MTTAAVEAKLASLPDRPGVYLFRDAAGAVLYVGKALSLRSRVRSYFRPARGDERRLVEDLVRQVADLETILTRTEKEALLLENQLIKELRPRLNVKLRDDKEYLSLRLDRGQPFPRLEVVRRPTPDGARYFGPYHSASAARQTLRLVNRSFQLRTCSDDELGARTRPCLQHQIHRCPAPCVLDVDRAAYAAQVDHVALFLDGRHDELVERLESEMWSAARAHDYERAAVLRNQLRAVARVRETQRVAIVSRRDQDVFGFHREGGRAVMAVLQVRQGRLVGVRSFELEDGGAPQAELVEAALADYYSRGTFLPDEILVPEAPASVGALGEALSERRGRRVRVVVPRRGVRATQLEMAAENAAHAFRERARARTDAEARVAELQRALDLPVAPERIECLDVSHLGGTHTFAAFSALRGGALDRSRYRTFRVRHATAADDYGAMYEVLSRRVRRAATTEGWELPDLLVVDGGRGQLRVASAALADLGARDCAVVALAKEKRGDEGGPGVFDRVFVPGRKNPVVLREHSPALQLLALARDEAHRLSNRRRVASQSRTLARSQLDDVPGVGPRTRARLLRALGSVGAIAAASDEALRAAGATVRQVTQIRRHLTR